MTEDPENYAKKLNEKNLTEKEKWRNYHHYQTIDVLAEKAKPGWKKKLGNILDKLQKTRKAGKGFMNAEGRFFNYHEWHAAAWGAGLIFLYFLLDQGIFLVLFIYGIAKTWKDACGHDSCDSGLNYFKSEIAKNVHYYMGAGLAVGAAFMLAGWKPPDVESGLVTAVVSSVLGA